MADVRDFYKFGDDLDPALEGGQAEDGRRAAEESRHAGGWLSLEVLVHSGIAPSGMGGMIGSPASRLRSKRYR